MAVRQISYNEKLFHYQHIIPCWSLFSLFCFEERLKWFKSDTETGLGLPWVLLKYINLSIMEKPG